MILLRILTTKTRTKTKAKTEKIAGEDTWGALRTPRAGSPTFVFAFVFVFVFENVGCKNLDKNLDENLEENLNENLGARKSTTRPRYHKIPAQWEGLVS